MSTEKAKRSGLMSLDFFQMIASLFQAGPKKLADGVAGDVMQAREKAQAHIEQARTEIANGARPPERHFRL